MKKENWGFYAPMWSVFILLTAEYFVLLGEYMSMENLLWRIVGYSLLVYLLVCNYHGKSVYLRYEQMLSIDMKLIFCDLICTVFIAGANGTLRLWIITIEIILLQIVSVWLLNKLCWLIVKDKDDSNKKIVYVYPNDNKGTKMMEIDKADMVYLCDIPAGHRNDYIKYCLLKDKPVYFNAKLTDVQLRTAVLAESNDSPIFGYEWYGIGKKHGWLKRFFDFLLALLLLIFLSPLFALCALAIKLCDGGPVFYKQVRCTKDMKEFKIIKFRSMVVNAEAMSGPMIAESKDPRMTAIGYWLRKFKLDEIPQLINILKGEMSFVGPRPERPEIIAEIIEDVPEFVFRTKVPAGLTGYAQVHGDYHTGLLDKLKWDLMYIENHSLLLDFKIMLMTVPTVFRGSGDVKEEAQVLEQMKLEVANGEKHNLEDDNDIFEVSSARNPE